MLPPPLPPQHASDPSASGSSFSSSFYHFAPFLSFAPGLPLSGGAPVGATGTLYTSASTTMGGGGGSGIVTTFRTGRSRHVRSGGGGGLGDGVGGGGRSGGMVACSGSSATATAVRIAFVILFSCVRSENTCPTLSLSSSSLARSCEHDHGECVTTKEGNVSS